MLFFFFIIIIIIIIGFPAQFHKCVVWFHIQSIQIHDTCDRRGESSFKFIFVRSN